MLEMEDALAEEVRTMKRKLPELRTGKHGQLMEWLEDYEEAEPGHRHISHLYGVFPGNQIDGMEAARYVCNEKMVRNVRMIWEIRKSLQRRQKLRWNGGFNMEAAIRDGAARGSFCYGAGLGMRTRRMKT
ncbi:MAG: hypothetical protein LUH00_01025 [Lachnospiraceae bacterium]|nr:hypothetical protein [Lachnospiraceae bacterium]